MADRILFQVSKPAVRICAVCPGDLVQVELFNGSGAGVLINDANGLLPHLSYRPRFDGWDVKRGGAALLGSARPAQALAGGPPELTFRVDLGKIYCPWIGEVYIAGGSLVDPVGTSLTYTAYFTKSMARERVPQEHSLSYFAAGQDSTGTRVTIARPQRATHVWAPEPTAVHLSLSSSNAPSVGMTLYPGDRYPLGVYDTVSVDAPPAPALHFAILL